MMQAESAPPADPGQWAVPRRRYWSSQSLDMNVATPDSGEPRCGGSHLRKRSLVACRSTVAMSVVSVGGG